jgi:hypothetical protein
MVFEQVIKRRIKKLKKTFPDLEEKRLERELIPLSGEEIQPKVLKKKVKQ